MMSDFRFAIRSLRRTPVFSATVIGILALGIGGSTAVFSVVNQVLLRPLPYSEPGELVRLYQGYGEERAGERRYVSGFAYRGYAERMQSLESVAASYTYRETGGDLSLNGGAERLRLLPVTSSYFEVLRAAPSLGRTFTEAEERDGGVVVLSDAIWRSRFDRSPSVLGTVVQLSGEPHTVIGVAAPELEDPVVGAVDMWLPLDAAESLHPQNHSLTVLARLRPGVDVAEAQAELALLDRALAEEDARGADRPSAMVGLHEDTVAGAERMLLVLLGAVGLVLLIVCVNVANLLLARSTSRERELAVRAAMGASRRRLAGQLLLESVALGIAGGVAGTLLGLFLLDAIRLLGDTSVPRLAEASFDVRVLLFASCVSIGAALLFGLVPALRFSRVPASGVLRDSARTVTSDRKRQAVRSLLVGAQMALAFMLLVGASILTLSLYRLTSVDLGFVEDDVVTFEVHLPDARYDAPRRAAFHEELATRLMTLPGVAAAGAVSRLPATGSYHPWGSRPVSGPLAGTIDGSLPSEQRVVAGQYFDVMGIELLRGRLFDERDDAASPRRVVISERLAASAFPGTDPLGQQLTVLGDTVTVIGVVSDVAVTAEGDVAPVVYHAHRQFADDRNWPLTQVVRTRMDEATTLAAARDALRELDSELVLHRPLMLADVVGRGIAQRRFTTWLMTGFAALAVLLATTGLFGVIAYVVRQRRRELGIRAALGARPAQIRAMVLTQGLTVSGAGIIAGLAGSLALGRVLASLVFETSPADPLVLLAACVMMTTVAAAAAFLPAREATKIDPREALVDE